MPKPVRIPFVPVPCATSTPHPMQCPAGGGLPVYPFAALVVDCLHQLARLDKQAVARAPEHSVSREAVSPRRRSRLGEAA